MSNLSKGAKVALRHAANAIDGTRGAQPRLGASTSVNIESSTDRQGRPYASVYLAERQGFTVHSQDSAQRAVVSVYGLSIEQVQKLDTVAASTHNVKQRGDRVAGFLRRVVANPDYVGQTRQATTGAVAATL